MKTIELTEEQHKMLKDLLSMCHRVHNESLEPSEIKWDEFPNPTTEDLIAFNRDVTAR